MNPFGANAHPNSLSFAIKNKWDDYMAKTKRSTWRGVGRTGETWAVSARGAVMGNILALNGHAGSLIGFDCFLIFWQLLQTRVCPPS